MATKRGQGMIEFVVIFAAILFFFVTFFLAIQESTSDKTQERQEEVAKELALLIKTEVDLAHEASEGYSRNFFIPYELFGKQYSVAITEIGVYLESETIGLSYPTLSVEGNLTKGWNTITKENGDVLLNP